MKIPYPAIPRTKHVGRGHVDVYVWKGRPVARAWPKKPYNPKTPRQQQTRHNFGKISHALPGIYAGEYVDVIRMATEQNSTKRDIAMRAAYGNLIRWPGQGDGAPNPNLNVDFAYMQCSSKVMLYAQQFLPEVVHALWTTIKPSQVGIFKNFLGIQRQCGLLTEVAAVEEEDVSFAQGLIREIFVMPPIAEQVLMYVWIGGIVGGIARSFSSSLHIVETCVMNPHEGTCIVGGNNFQPFTLTTDWLQLNASTTQQDPAAWSHTPAARIAPGFRGEFQIMGAMTYGPFRPNIDFPACELAVQVGPTPGAIYDVQVGGVATVGHTVTLVVHANVHMEADQSVGLVAKNTTPGQIANPVDLIFACGTT